jgi:hypothetical protein
MWLLWTVLYTVVCAHALDEPRRLAAGFGSAEGKAASLNEFQDYVIECAELPSIMDTTDGLGAWLLWVSLKKACEGETRTSFSLAKDGSLVSQLIKVHLLYAQSDRELELEEMQNQWGSLASFIKVSKSGGAPKASASASATAATATSAQQHSRGISRPAYTHVVR